MKSYKREILAMNKVKSIKITDRQYMGIIKIKHLKMTMTNRWKISLR
jgi:hypothetical protein